MHRVPMTVHGEKKLREELQNLKQVQRPNIIQAIAEARSHGDLKENAEYHAAREQQAFIEGRILELEGKLANAQVIDISRISNDGKVIFGASVTLINVQNDEEQKYMLVGDDEADYKIGKISINSPIARALIGKYEGAAVMVKAPAGDVEYEISKVEYI